ncbi:hypothetical protein B5M42_009475 [Paenibacillus athensensis]|uniref:Uncharacterized protein n=1 Tax=Paenibacillus athensensis TaxID=1967502 RepID=A0A4Y8QBI9_9BACL|nr:hypothetical protein [Paenibacillus athensensis]MCD1259066.1 hypothetical protein [Paenibacillus athensensis]
MHLVINVFFSFLEFLAGMSLANVLFRLPYENYKLLKQVLISLFLGILGGYFFIYWPQLGAYTFAFKLFMWIIAMTVVFRISIWYSALIGIISALIGGGLELVGYLITNLIQAVNLGALDESARNIVLGCVSVLLYGISLYLGSKKIGFHIPNIYSKPPLNKLSMIVSAILLASLFALMIAAYLFTGMISLTHVIVVFSLLACVSLTVAFSYQFNKKLLLDKYTRNGQQPWI